MAGGDEVGAISIETSSTSMYRYRPSSSNLGSGKLVLDPPKLPRSAVLQPFTMSVLIATSLFSGSLLLLLHWPCICRLTTVCTAGDPGAVSALGEEKKVNFQIFKTQFEKCLEKHPALPDTAHMRVRY